MYGLRKIRKPEIFQGKHKKRNYFEGWYFKFTNWDKNIAYALIPGISVTDYERKAFIQVIDGMNNKTYNFDFNYEDFTYSDKEFRIKIKDNVFSKTFMKFNLKNDEIELSGIIDFEDIVDYPKSLLRPGIMGIFSYFPNMECNHGVVNVSHRTSGHIIIDNREISVDSGRGYIEKDWGTSFPVSYIWMQGNDFNNEQASFMLSIAKVPFMGRSFTGFLGFLYLKDHIYTFGTYTKAKITDLTFKGNELHVTIKKGKYTICVKGISENQSGGELKAPVKGAMSNIIKESLNSILDVTLFYNDNVIFRDRALLSGLEIYDDAKELINERDENL